ncbi:pimeloyl-[acyl-carrier protein] methyl ester esterase [Alteromonadaceae bacterium M269]|nr:pimeloyl-[acyl-carrier protein] methyl ester esterase [Alteromonadaceae bacterium M269]
MTEKLRVSSYGQGPELALLHGWGLNSGVWEGILPKLTPHYRVNLIDLPGFGINHDILPESYDLESVAELVLDVIPQGSILLGWSLGGLIAQHITINTSDHIQRLILLCTSPKFQATDEWHGIAEPVLSLFHQQLEGNFSKTLERFLAIQAMGSPSAKSDIRQLKQAIGQYPEPAMGALNGGLNLLSTVDLRQELSRIEVPTFWCFGRLDSLVPQKAIEPIQQLQPNAKHLIMHKASHAPFVSHLDGFADILLDEIRGC